MFKPLIINRDFLFANSPGGECLRAFIAAMDSSKWHPYVYASDRFPVLEDFSNDTKLIHEKKYIRFIAAALRRLLPDLTWLPGYEWQSWGKRTAKQIIKDIETKRINPDYIHSISYPVASHWVALKIKKATGLPLVLQFYDPWADNPYRPFRTKWLKDMDWRMERECVEAADLIIHDNYKIADMWRTRYGEVIGNRIKVLPLTIPLPTAKVSPILKRKDSLLVISHIGNFMLNRTASPFIKALRGLLLRRPDVRHRIVINFVGKVIEDDMKLIKQYGLDDIFVVHGTLSAKDCEPYYSQTDVFLAVDGVNPDNVFFPSKLLKYFYFSRPILGITPKGSVMDRELENAKHAHFSEDEQDAIIEYLEKAIYDYDSICSFDKDYWQRFRPITVVEEYETFVKRLF